MANNQNHKKQKEPIYTFESVWKTLNEVSVMQKALTKKQEDLTDKQADLTDKQADLTKKQADLTKKQANTTRNINMLDGDLKKTRRIVDQVTQNIDRVSRETAKNINKLRGDWDHQWGEFVEVLISDNLERLFESYGIVKGEVETFTNRVYRSVSGLTLFEFDSITTNGDKVIITEAKKKMTKAKVNDFVERVKKFLAIKNNEFANKKVYIAIGYLKAENEKNLIGYAENLGLFVIKAAGDNAVLINSLQTFKPQQFNPHI